MKNRYQNTFFILRSRKGMTFLELAIVICILGIISGITFPLISNILAKGELRKATYEIVTDIALTRMESINKRQVLGIEFLDSKRKYHIYQDRDHNGHCSYDEIIKTKNFNQLFPGVSFRVVKDPLFQPWGSISDSKIVISNRSGSRTVEISVTGRVVIKS